MENTGCKIICGAPTTLAVKGLMMMMMMIMMMMMMMMMTAHCDGFRVHHEKCVLSSPGGRDRRQTNCDTR